MCVGGAALREPVSRGGGPIFPPQPSERLSGGELGSWRAWVTPQHGVSAPSCSLPGTEAVCLWKPLFCKEIGIRPPRPPGVFTVTLPHPLLCFSAHQLHKGGELFLKAQGAFL